MTASRPGNPANLRKATAARTAAAAARADAAIDRMISAGQPVTFRGVAAAAPASLDFLYRQPVIRQRIEQLRDQPPRRQQANASEPGSVITALTGELAELKRRHREQVAELQRALQAAHGENLTLRRRIGGGSNAIANPLSRTPSASP